jgi:hypothetical protein
MATIAKHVHGVWSSANNQRFKSACARYYSAFQTIENVFCFFKITETFVFFTLIGFSSKMN